MTDGRRLVLSTIASGSRFHYAQALIKRIVIHALYDVRAAIGFLAKKLEGTARRAPLSFSLLTTAALFTIVFATLAPSFHSNDDPQLAMIAAGKGACLRPTST